MFNPHVIHTNRAGKVHQLRLLLFVPMTVFIRWTKCLTQYKAIPCVLLSNLRGNLCFPQNIPTALEYITWNNYKLDKRMFSELLSQTQSCLWVFRFQPPGASHSPAASMQSISLSGPSPKPSSSAHICRRLSAFDSLFRHLGFFPPSLQTFSCCDQLFSPDPNFLH